MVLAGGLVVARAHPGPRGQVPRGGKPAHAHPEFGDEHLGGALADSGDGVRPVPLGGEGRHLGVDLLVERGDGRGELVDVGQHQPGQGGVVGGEIALQRLGLRGRGGPWPPVAEPGENLRVAFALDQGGEHGPARSSEHVADHGRQFQPGVFEQLLQPLRLSGALMDQAGPVADQVAQLADRGRRHEAGPDQAVLDQLGDPDRVGHVGRAPRHVADVPGVEQLGLDGASSR